MFRTHLAFMNTPCIVTCWYRALTTFPTYCVYERQSPSFYASEISSACRRTVFIYTLAGGSTVPAHSVPGNVQWCMVGAHRHRRFTTPIKNTSLVFNCSIVIKFRKRSWFGLKQVLVKVSGYFSEWLQ